MATTLFRGPVLQGKFNEAGVTGFNLNEKNSAYSVLTSDLGKSFTSKSGSPTFTIHTFGVGYTFTFTNTGGDATNGVIIKSAAVNEISFAAGTHQYLTNTKATSKVGDFVTIHSVGSLWAVIGIQGTWVGSD